MIAMLLASMGRAERLEAMRRGFTSKTEPGSGVWVGMLVVALIGILALAGLLLLNRVQQGRRRRASGTAYGLFREVLRGLPLGFHDRALLRRLATEMRIKNPTIVLLTPELLAETAYGYVAAKPGKAQADMTRLRAICTLLFGQEMPEPQGPDPPRTG